jgi:hypothetical protein
MLQFSWKAAIMSVVTVCSPRASTISFMAFEEGRGHSARRRRARRLTRNGGPDISGVPIHCSPAFVLDRMACRTGGWLVHASPNSWSSSILARVGGFDSGSSIRSIRTGTIFAARGQPIQKNTPLLSVSPYRRCGSSQRLWQYSDPRRRKLARFRCPPGFHALDRLTVAVTAGA